MSLFTDRIRISFSLRAAVLYSLFISFTVVAHPEKECRHIIEALGTGAKSAARLVVPLSLKIMNYPLYRMVTLNREILKPTIEKHGKIGLWRAPFELLKKDWLVLGMIALLNWEVDLEYTSGIQYVDETRDLMPEDPDAVIVLVDGFLPGDLMRFSALYLWMANYRKYKNVYYVRGTWPEIEAQLSTIKKKHGGAHLVDFVSHGRTGGSLRNYLDEEHRDLDLHRSQKLEAYKDLILPGGAFRDFTCYGGTNKEFMNAFGQLAVQKEGTLVGSKLSTRVQLSQILLGGAELVVGELPPVFSSLAVAFDKPVFLMSRAFKRKEATTDWKDRLYRLEIQK